jgi:hypothetical protein
MTTLLHGGWVNPENFPDVAVEIFEAAFVH